MTSLPPPITHTRLRRFRMIKHARDDNNTKSERRFNLLSDWKTRVNADGLNSLEARLDHVIKYYTHTRLFISPSMNPEGKNS